MAQRHRRKKEKSLITLTPDRDWRLQLASVHLPRQFHPRLVNGQVKIYLFPPQKKLIQKLPKLMITSSHCFLRLVYIGKFLSTKPANDRDMPLVLTLAPWATQRNNRNATIPCCTCSWWVQYMSSALDCVSIRVLFATILCQCKYRFCLSLHWGEIQYKIVVLPTNSR